MNRRMAGKEHSLNAPIGEDGDEWQDWVIDQNMDQELKIAQQEEMDQRKDLLSDSIKILNEREKKILYSRRLTDNPSTLEELSKKFKISRERIRQIETKITKHMLNSQNQKIYCLQLIFERISIKIFSGLTFIPMKLSIKFI